VDQTQTISIRGETLHLLSEKAIHWPGRESLLVADTHFGKAATFRSFGIPVPDTTQTTLDRLSRVIKETSTRRLILLGDFIHSNMEDRSGFEALLEEWRAAHQDLEILLLRGNHDRGRADLFMKLQIAVQDSWTEPPFEFAHDTEMLASSELYGVGGHVHPQVVLSEGKKKLRLSCFWFGERLAILPAFGDFTGCGNVNPVEGDSVFVIADGEVVKLSESSLRQATANCSR
jgi:DNA ligase-associated metallophosphoesterase